MIIRLSWDTSVIDRVTPVIENGLDMGILDLKEAIDLLADSLVRTIRFEELHGYD